MNFDDELRERLHQLPGPDRAPAALDTVVARGRRRQLRRRAGTAVLATVALLAAAVGTAEVLSRRSDTIGVATTGLGVGSGPLDLSWAEPVDGGLSWLTTGASSDDGALYALSTAPGSRVIEQNPPQAVYRLGDDGSWVPVAESGKGQSLADIAAGTGGLYAVGTAPSTSGAGVVPVLSRSGDDGATWDRQELDTIEDPPGTADWRGVTQVSVEAIDRTAVAVVSTQLWLDARSFGIVPTSDWAYRVQWGASGASLLRHPVDEARPEGSAPATTTPLRDPGPGAEAVGEEVAVRTWADLGVAGVGDLSRTSVWLDRGDGWDEVTPPAALIGGGLAHLDAVGDQFVLRAPAPDGVTAVVLSSADGVAWREIHLPGLGRLEVLGDTWVTIDSSTLDPFLMVSNDQGGTWRQIDLPVGDVAPSGDLGIGSWDGGPLGLALIVLPLSDSGPGDPTLLTTTDLQSWVVTPVREIVEVPDRAASPPLVMVGADRIVLSATECCSTGPDDIPRTFTAVGTPVRS
jgi:hypothetical protein